MRETLGISLVRFSNVVAIYVPDTAVSDYKSSVISGYASIIFPLSEYNGYMPTKLYEI